MPKLTIIVPVYNVEKYLNKCVDSILAQTYKDFELLLIDDGSPDSSPKICDEYAKKDGRVKVVHKANGGVSSARNLGIELAKGDYIGFVDSDDYIEQDMYAELISHLEKNNADISICGFKCIDDDNNVLRIQDSREEFVLDRENILSKIFDVPWSIRLDTLNKIFKSEIIKKIKFDETLKCSEDTLFLHEYLSRVNVAVFFLKPLYVNVVHSGSAMNGSLKPKAYYSSYAVDEKIVGEIVKEFPSLKRRAYLFLLDNSSWKIEKVCTYYTKKSDREDVAYIRKMKKELKKITLRLLFNSHIPLTTRVAYFLSARGLRNGKKYRLKSK